MFGSVFFFFFSQKVFPNALLIHLPIELSIKGKIVENVRRQNCKPNAELHDMATFRNSLLVFSKDCALEICSLLHCLLLIQVWFLLWSNLTTHVDRLGGQLKLKS